MGYSIDEWFDDTFTKTGVQTLDTFLKAFSASGADHRKEQFIYQLLTSLGGGDAEEGLLNLLYSPYGFESEHALTIFGSEGSSRTLGILPEGWELRIKSPQDSHRGGDLCDNESQGPRTS